MTIEKLAIIGLAVIVSLVVYIALWIADKLIY
jgi:hypothetical protein